MARTRRTVRLDPDIYERLAIEAARRGENVDDVAERTLRDHLPVSGQTEDVLGSLCRLEALRTKMKPGAGAALLVREGRNDLDRRIA
jgi:hypothetical protein